MHQNVSLLSWDCVEPSRVTEIHHTTVMRWIREAGHQLPDAPEAEEIPEITDAG
ncbi:hypothetical protein H6F74_28310 [Trichocoleus sp. FACHB-90]|uniref:hypothetical protein n=1 Tax=Cyanophyceae TaxID=3028117 RepID=UPI0016889E0B|nr:hypothetical protein [Trichocoleus sp. FACHB-90]MBD1930095.1 hypothetical protein [Trichocoleus sp. FACHB-90]